MPQNKQLYQLTYVLEQSLGFVHLSHPLTRRLGSNSTSYCPLLETNASHPDKVENLRGKHGAGLRIPVANCFVLPISAKQNKQLYVQVEIVLGMFVVKLQILHSYAASHGKRSEGW